MLRKIALFLLVVGLYVNGAYAEENSPFVSPIQAELIQENTAIQPGQPFWVALRLNVEKGWHFYWKNPGDAGLAPSVEWQLPPGFTAGALEWPYPHRFEIDSLVGFGYEGDVWLLAPITPPKDLKETSVKISAKVDWLVCDDASCLPGSATVKADLNVSPEAAPSSKSGEFAKARALLPSKDWQIEALRKGDLIELKLQAPQENLPSFTEVEFFPESASVVDSKVQAVLTQDPEQSGVFRVVLRSEGNASLLKGIAVLREGHGEQSKATAIDVQSSFITVGGEHSEAIAEGPHSTLQAEDPASFEEMVPFEGGVALALVLAFAGGIILNLMPCVLPVISFKVFSFVKMAGQSRSITLKHGLAFSFGVILSFWILAGLMLLLQAYGRSVGWGFQLQEPLFVAFLAGLVLVFGLSLFGVFELGASVMGLASQAQGQQEGLTASFLSGILATAVATPCTGPFLGSAIGFAVTLPPLQALLIFTSLGLGMASPYLILAFYPSLLRFLPKPGPWMVTFKEFMGFLMIATVIWLMWVFGAQTSALGVILLLAAFFFTAVGCWIYGKWGSPVRSVLSRRISYLFVTFCLACAGTLIYNSTSPLVMAYAPDTARVAAWEEFSEERIAELQKQGIPVFVDFTAKWCLICQANHLVLSTENVDKKFAELGVVRMKADWTKNDEKITAALRKFGRNGVPLYVMYGANAEEAPQILPQVLTPDNVLQHLEKVSSQIAER